MAAKRSRADRDLEEARRLVEEVLEELGLRAGAEQLEGGWALTRGAAPVYVFVAPQGEHGMIQVVAPVMALPAGGRVALLRRLLELNGEELVSAGFGVKEGTVVITTDRSLADLDRSEVREMILRISHYGHHFQRELEAEFGSSGAGTGR
jgi:hypothetical protein